MMKPEDGFLNPCASACASFEEKRIVVVVVSRRPVRPLEVSFAFLGWGKASQRGKAIEIFEIAIALSSVCVNSETQNRKMEKAAKEKRKLRRTRTGSTFCFLAFALPPAVCALAPLAPPASDLPPPLVVVAAPDLPLAAAPLAASECAVNVSYTVGTALILEKSASLYKREKSDKGKGKHTHRQSSHRRRRRRHRRQTLLLGLYSRNRASGNPTSHEPANHQ